MHHHGATARTGKQLAPPWGHRTYRKTACITAGPPHVPENSLHHHEATARTGTQLAPPRGHRTYRNTACTNAGPPQAPEPSWRSVEATVFPDSAFRFLSRQVTESGLSARLKLRLFPKDKKRGVWGEIGAGARNIRRVSGLGRVPSWLHFEPSWGLFLELRKG